MPTTSLNYSSMWYQSHVVGAEAHQTCHAVYILADLAQMLLSNTTIIFVCVILLLHHCFCKYQLLNQCWFDWTTVLLPVNNDASKRQTPNFISICQVTLSDMCTTLHYSPLMRYVQTHCMTRTSRRQKPFITDAHRLTDCTHKCLICLTFVLHPPVLISKYGGNILGLYASMYSTLVLFSSVFEKLEEAYRPRAPLLA